MKVNKKISYNILFQVIITTGTMLMWPTIAMERMPIISVKHVELFCDTPVTGFTIPLSYNIFLILCCTVLGYRTRSLPDNFNDSKYIFLCSCATMFLWVVLIPTYFAVFYSQHKVILLSLALILNSTVITLTLFCPKIYALYWLTEDQMHIKHVGSVGLSVGPGLSTGASTRVTHFKHPLNVTEQEVNSQKVHRNELDIETVDN